MSVVPNGGGRRGGGDAENEGSDAPSIQVRHLSYAFPDGSSGLQDVSVDLPPGSRTLLIGGEVLRSSLPFLSVAP
jgi:ABC-type multidrug transport system fused ATPase/permease subunit